MNQSLVAGGLSWRSATSTLCIARPARGVVVLVVSGTDIGEHGDAPFEALLNETEEGEPIELFIDARNTRGVALEVSSRWARWLSTWRGSLTGVDMLAASPFVRLTASFVRKFASLGELMRVHTDPETFDRRLAEAVRRSSSTPPPPKCEASA